MNQNVMAWRDEFLKRKKKNEERPEDIAQRLVNIYRQLYIMDEQTTQRYNALLLETATDEILTALKTIPGGEEIREYYAFLRKVTSNDDTEQPLPDEKEDVSDAAFINMTLPKAEELSPLWQSFGSAVAMGAAPVSSVPVADAKPVVNTVTQPPVIKTVYVEKNVMLDSDKLKGDMSSLLSGYQDQVLSSLKGIVIDSDIEKMHQNIKKAIDKVQQEMTTTCSALNDLLSTQNYLVEDETDADAVKRKGPSPKQLNKIKNQNHKYAVDMDEGDFS